MYGDFSNGLENTRRQGWSFAVEAEEERRFHSSANSVRHLLHKPACGLDRHPTPCPISASLHRPLVTAIILQKYLSLR
jgi:hypothetical protein